MLDGPLAFPLPFWRKLKGELSGLSPWTTTQALAPIEVSVNQAALKPKVSTEDALLALERVAADAAAEPVGSGLTVERTQTDLSLPVLMRRVVSEYGKSFNQLIGDFARLGFGPGKLSVEEYLDLRPRVRPPVPRPRRGNS